MRLAADDERRPDVVALALALDTDNPEAQQAVVDLALACPPQLAAELSAKVSEFLRTPFQWRLPFKARDLVVHLMLGGQSAAALGLLPALIAPSGRHGDMWRSTSLLGELIRDLFPAADLAGLGALADLLDADLDADERTRARDHSYIWRPTLEGGRRWDLRDTLVSALRDAAAAIVAGDNERAAEVIEVLEARPRSVFRRLALHLLRRFPEDGLVADRLGDRERFDDINLEREYDVLIRERFGDLPDEIRQRVLAWIEEGAAPGDGEDEAGRRERWQLRQLVRLGDDLPDHWRERRDELAEVHGPPPERLPRGAVWSGALAPLEREALEALTVREVVAYLQTWSPEDGFGGPSREGLARLLEQAVAADPARFAAEAAAFADVQPAYAHALVSGLRTALSNADEGSDPLLEWPQVLEFARRALEQPRILPGRTENDLGEPEAGWIGTRTDIARLLQVALGRRQVPADLSAEVLAIIAALLDDSHPDRGYEQRWHRQGTDAPLLALNSVRGAALHALMQYAWWRRHQTAEGEEPRLDERVHELLERHLDPATEETEAIHSVYGEWFPFLLDLDHPWAAGHVEEIFPLDGEQQRRGQVAWDSYVLHNRAWPDTFAFLGPQYEAAIERFVAAAVDDGHEAEDRREALLGHLLGLYVQGAVTLDDAVLGRFLDGAPLAPRARLLELIGHDLTNAEDRYQRRRRCACERSGRVVPAVAAAMEAGDTDAVNELAAFSWWFAAGVCSMTPGHSDSWRRC